MRSEARWFIRSLGSGRAGTAGTSGYMRRCRRRLRFMALPSPAGAELPARLRPRQSCPALLRFALVWCSLVWFGVSPQQPPSFPLPTRQGVRSASWDCAPVLAAGRSARTGIHYYYYWFCVTISRPNLTLPESKPAEDSGAILK